MSRTRILRDYEDTFVPPVTGRFNNGVICYYNALDAALKSLPLFNKIMCNILDEEKPLAFCKIYAKEILDTLDAVPGTINTNTSLISVLQSTIKNFDEIEFQKKANETTIGSDPISFDLGQCDASEAFIKMIEVLGKTYPSILKLFQYRYTETIECTKCNGICKKEIILRVSHDMQILKQPPGEHIEDDRDLFVHNLLLSFNIIEDYACPMCNGWRKTYDDENNLEPSRDVLERMKKLNQVVKPPSIITQTLNLVPEILVINLLSPHAGSNSNKYSGNTIKYPNKFRLPKKIGDEFVYYKLVSQIQKTGGSTVNGHYTARCLRKGMVYLINDARLSESKFKANSSTTMVFYHSYIPTASDPYE